MAHEDNDIQKKIKLKQILWFNIFAIFAILSAIFYYNSITNTLKNNGKWISNKTLLENSVMGAFATMETTRALAGNRLDLGVWHGNQELFLKDLKPYNDVKFKANLATNGHFSFYYHISGDTISGIRVSNNPDFPSIEFRVLDGRFVEQYPINYIINSEKNNRIHFQIIKNEIVLTINKNDVLKHKVTFGQGNTFGLRGSERSAIIDNIVVSSETQEILLKEKFNKRKVSVLMWVVAIICLVLFNLFLYFFRSKPNIIIASITFVFLASFAGLIYQKAFNQYRYQKPKPIIKIIKPEKKDKDIVKTYKKKKNEEVRILFVGSSQTRGAGASIDDKSIIKSFERMLNQKEGTNKFVCINAAVSGQKSTELLNYYSYLRNELNPDIAIINLSYNDGYYDVSDSIFKWNIQQFININKEFGIKTILIQEPSNSDFPDQKINEKVASNRTIMARIANKNEVLIVSMQTFINDHKNDGFLFWDVVHLTDFGQQLFAEELLREFELLQE